MEGDIGVNPCSKRGCVGFAVLGIGFVLQKSPICRGVSTSVEGGSWALRDKGTREFGDFGRFRVMMIGPPYLVLSISLMYIIPYYELYVKLIVFSVTDIDTDMRQRKI